MSATKIFSCDFSALANQTCTASGGYTIGGVPWYAKGALNQGGNTYTRNLVNGSGLSLICSSNVAGTPIGSTGDLNFPHWSLPLSQVPDYSAAEPHLIRARFKYAPSTNTGAYLGLCQCTNDGVGLRAADRAKDHFAGPGATATTTSLLSVKNAAATVAGASTRHATVAPTSIVVGLQTHMFQGTTWELKGSEVLVSGMPASISTFLPVSGTGTTDPLFDPGARSNAGIFFGQNNATLSPHGVYLEQLEIWRLTTADPDVAPPDLSMIDPPAGESIARTRALTFRLTDGGSFALRELWVGFGENPDTYQKAYADGTWYGVYEAHSSATPVTGGWDIVLSRGGWPYGQKVTLRASVVDAGGNVVVISA